MAFIFSVLGKRYARPANIYVAVWNRAAVVRLLAIRVAFHSGIWIDVAIAQLKSLCEQFAYSSERQKYAWSFMPHLDISSMKRT